MARQIADQQKISLLIGAVLIFIFVSTIGFGAAIVYNMVRLQSGIQEAYQHPLSKTGFDMHATLSRLHNDMLQLVLLNDPTTRQRMNAEVLVLDGNIRNDLLVVKAELPGETEKLPG